MGETFSCNCTKEELAEEGKNQSSMLFHQNPPQQFSIEKEFNHKNHNSFTNGDENNNIFPAETLKTNNNPIKNISVKNTLSRNFDGDYDNEDKNTLKIINNKSIENNNNYYTPILQKAEKLFPKKLDFSNDYLKYTDNDELKNLVYNNEPNENIHYTDGINLEINNKKCFYKGNIDENNNLEGYGELFTEDGNKFEGIFKNNNLNGLGRYISNDGNCIEGIFKNYDIISKAKIYSIDDENKIIKYFGSVRNFKKDGKGMEFSEEYNYDGDFINGEKEGKGKINYINYGDLYEGEFHNDKINGKGFYIWQNKESYTGDFIDAKMHGYGLYKWPDGSQYEGEYINNIKEGNGIYKWKDGRVFKGRFEKGKPHGLGELTINGITVECEYRNGKCIDDLNKKIREKIKKNN